MPSNQALRKLVMTSESRSRAQFPYLISTFLPDQSSCNRFSTNVCISFAFITAIFTSCRMASVPRGTPPNFCKTHISFCAFNAIETSPALNRCSSCEGSSTGGVEASGKKANVKQNGVWWIARGTGARSVGRCYGRFRLNRS